jgi:high affinity sulfate transporter 1
MRGVHVVGEGLLPLQRDRVPADALAGITLAALAIPEVMGYTSIAGMPVVTGLYTILLPVFAFALLGSSRHLVVGADSATAAVMAASLSGMAVARSTRYVALAGLLALMAAGMLVIARFVRLGILADFLSRTVLVGFLSGVGIDVALRQAAAVLGVPPGHGLTVAGYEFTGTGARFASTLRKADRLSWATLAVAASVVAFVMVLRLIDRRIPGPLIAVVGGILVSWAADLSAHGVATVGPLPRGVPGLSFPDVSWSDFRSLLGTALSVVVLILAQSAATSRAYAARYEDRFDENRDLIGLAAANVFAGLSGAFVVNGSPTKTEMVDGAGGRSQVSQITGGIVVLLVLLFLTGPIRFMPDAVLAAVVLIIGIDLVDLPGLRRILRLRRDEFVVAAIVAVTVVTFGVEPGIVLALIASLIDHLRRSYRPHTSVLTAARQGRGWHGEPAAPDARTEPGLVVYRFAGSLYYANCEFFSAQVSAFAESAHPPEWICIDAAAIPDVDYSGGEILHQLHTSLSRRGIRLVIAEPMGHVRRLLQHYGFIGEIGAGAVFDTVGEAVAAFNRRTAPTS